MPTALSDAPSRRKTQPNRKKLSTLGDFHTPKFLGLSDSQVIHRIGFNRCVASVGCSSRRRGDRACLSMPRHAPRGIGSRARRRPEWPFVRATALDAETSTNISITLSPEELRDRLAAPNPRPAVALTGRIAQLLPSSDHTHATIVPMNSVPERARLREPKPWQISPSDDLIGV